MFMNRIVMLLWKNFGHCQNCMRQAFRLTFLWWAATAISFVLPFPNVFLACIAASVLFTSLWVTHVIVFALKTASYAVDDKVHPRSGLSRRELGKALVLSFGFAGATNFGTTFTFAADLPGGGRAGLPGRGRYELTSCCRNPSGVCRCGSAAGYRSDCSTPCGVSLTEVRNLVRLASMPTFTVSGQLIHVRTRAPLSGETVRLVLPGGESLSTVTDQQGRFRIGVGARSTRNLVDVGRLPSVASEERETGEPPEFYFFLRSA
ncbi:Protein of unknown function (DUF3624) [Microvirga lotononidis]|uniref:Carboxypeptidase regulatory-like domain-containing protein n=1 Tax=Microvirga lotononidis TaxID=864069 RepID=I4Z0X6_9HYPH|nr:Protein of unknown function (DUF3624) [Microvirga lotononidis]EIM29868.1 Protein of unknown function (DUF3624) [Microvirga lotononidis]WQO31049.1 hypothetical protein U0023_32580 [Microvirga lotononidis]